LFEKALFIAYSFKEDRNKASALASIAPYLPDNLRMANIPKFMLFIEDIKSDAEKAKAILKLLPHFPKST